MEPDMEKFLPYTENWDLTQAQKEEIILTVWKLMESQVDQAFKDTYGD